MNWLEGQRLNLLVLYNVPKQEEQNDKSQELDVYKCMEENSLECCVNDT